MKCCGKIYCQSCITAAFKEKKCCPTCKAQRVYHWPDKNKKQILSGLRVYCPHRRGTRLTVTLVCCDWQGQLGYLEQHLNKNPITSTLLEGCRYTILKCPLCRLQIKRHNLQFHIQDSCPNRPYTCQYCGHEDTYVKVLNGHSSHCPKEPIACPHCEAVFERQALDCHIDKECELVPILCVFNTVGCEVELPRRDMPTHLKKEINSHVKLLRLHTEENLPLFARCLELVLAENRELRSAVSKLASECQRLALESQNVHRDLRNLKSKHENLQCCVYTTAEKRTSRRVGIAG